ncbi:hypothetical protein E3Q24_03959 [Wallemia mellicola]|nr:hypothetical protein E3Q24_03959 [Wallemia mellicola]
MEKLSRRSINLAISSRALTTIKAIDGENGNLYHNLVTNATIPMKGRMIHITDGSLDSQLYSNKGECIYAIDRQKLNNALISEAESIPNVSFKFKSKIRAVNFDERELSYETTEGLQSDNRWDFMIGADGAHSVVRNQLTRVIRMDYAQEYIPHAYLELSIPPGPIDPESGEPSFLLDPNHLHIWPRQSFMLIALPNQDHSFTCTLFAPFEKFTELADNKDNFIQFFRQDFPDALKLMGEESAAEDYINNPKGSLVTIKCSPYHYKDRAVVLGDAAHSMVPFYGQGMNAGFEDVRVLLSLMDSEGVSSSKKVKHESLLNSLNRYSEERERDLKSIVNLAMGNYVEMRSKVINPIYLLRKQIDGVLNKVFRPPSVPSANILARTTFPTAANSGWMSLYELVTFRPDISFERKRPAALHLQPTNSSGPPTGYLQPTPGLQSATIEHNKELEHLHSTALKYWEKYDTSDCVVVLPFDDKSTSVKRSRSFTNLLDVHTPLSARRRSSEVSIAAIAGIGTKFNYDISSPDLLDDYTMFWPPVSHDSQTPRASFASMSTVKPSRTPSVVSEAGSGSLLRPTHNIEEDPSPSQSRLLVLHLHKDFLVTQSNMFKTICEKLDIMDCFNNQADTRSIQVKTETVVADTRKTLHELQKENNARSTTVPRILPSSGAIYLPLPDPYAFLYLVQALYCGHGPFLESHLDWHVVKWEGLVQNSEYLGIDPWVKRVLGRWWNKRVNRRPSNPATPLTPGSGTCTPSDLNNTFRKTVSTTHARSMRHNNAVHTHSNLKQSLHEFDLNMNDNGVHAQAQMDSVDPKHNQSDYEQPPSPKSEVAINKRLKQTM